MKLKKERGRSGGALGWMKGGVADIENNFRFSNNMDDGKIEREITVTPYPMTKYSIDVYTGNVTGAGTDSNVHIILFGKKVSVEED